MKASALIKVLKEMIKKHGDKEVYSGGEEYPGEVERVRFVERGDGYIPSGSFDIVGGL